MLQRLRVAFWVLLALTPLVVLAKAAEHVDQTRWTNKYDHHFKKYAKHYFGAGFDWRWFKAQAIAESTLNPKARSKAGAMGLMQIMPSTFAEIRKSNPMLKDIREPKWNIAAGIYYNRQLYRRWGKYIEANRRLPFTFGSYNAGFGNIRKAYRKVKKANRQVTRWKQIEDFAPSQTRHYVRRIQGLMR